MIQENDTEICELVYELKQKRAKFVRNESAKNTFQTFKRCCSLEQSYFTYLTLLKKFGDLVVCVM